MTKPLQLVVTDMSGQHATNMPETIERLRKGGTWKKQRIIIIMPAADLVPAKCVLSWWNMAFPPNNGVIKILALGDEVGIAYSTAIESVLAHPQLSEWEYLLTIEHDNVIPADGAIRLVERMENHPEYAAIGGLYFTKGPGGCAQIWGDVKDPLINYRPQIPDPSGGLVECYGTAQGFTMYRLALFKDTRLRKPWFKTLNGKDGLGMSTQDLYLWNDLRQYGYRCAIDCSVKCGHHDLRGDFGPADTVW